MEAEINKIISKYDKKIERLKKKRDYLDNKIDNLKIERGKLLILYDVYKMNNSCKK